jgi:lipid-A-disaccharide synthase
MKYYIIAGERSGDLHGSNLVKSILKVDPDAHIRAWGGDYMQNAGAEIVVHYKELAIMGIWEVIRSIFKLQRYISRCCKDILEYQPDALILIDYAGFNLRIAKSMQKHNIRPFYYISPKIWAWNQSRAYKIKKYIQKMFVIMPFEVDFYNKFGMDVSYVGNPVFDLVSNFQPTQGFYKKYGFEEGKPIIGLLPGSRKQEVQKLLPEMIEVAKAYPDYQFGLSMISQLPKSMYEQALSLKNVHPVLEDNYNLLFNAEAAIVTSGTATLETALFDVPQIVVYKTSGLTYFIGKHFIKVDFISLVNLMIQKEVVKELIQDDVNAEVVKAEFEKLVHDEAHRQKILQGYSELRNLLGKSDASYETAKSIYHILAYQENDFT